MGLEFLCVCLLLFACLFGFFNVFSWREFVFVFGFFFFVRVLASLLKVKVLRRKPLWLEKCLVVCATKCLSS